MGTRSGSVGAAARTTAGEPVPAPGELQRAGHRRAGWPWLIVVVVLAIGKADAFAAVLHHRAEMIALLGLALVVSVLRPRPVGIAVTAAALLAFALAPRSTALGIALGLGAFVLLLALFIVIGTVLHARQDRAGAGSAR